MRAEIESTRKDSERYKREVSRLGRESIGRDREELMRGRQQFDDTNDMYDDNPARYSMHLNGNSRPGSAALQRTGSTTSNSSSRAPPARPPNNQPTFSPNEEKENAGGDALAQAAMRRKISPPLVNASSAGRTPQRPQFGMSREQSSASVNSGGSGEGENWKRAAEVTSQLKARIEAMKARQGLTKPSY